MGVTALAGESAAARRRLAAEAGSVKGKLQLRRGRQNRKMLIWVVMGYSEDSWLWQICAQETRLPEQRGLGARGSHLTIPHPGVQ